MFFEDAVEECIVDVKLMSGPATLSSQGEHRAHRHRLDNGTVCLAVVHAGTLREAANDPSCLVSIERAILLELVAKHPFATDDMGVGRSRYKRPCVIVEQRVVFRLHSLAPVRVLKSLVDRPRDGRDRRVR